MCDHSEVWRVQHFFHFNGLVNLQFSNKSKRIPFPGTGFRFSFWLRILQVLSPALLRHTSRVQRMFSWISRHLERVYGDGWVTEAKIKDTGKEKLKFIVTEDKHGSVWGKTRQKMLGGVKGGGGTYINPEKGGGYMYLEKIYVCACIWRTEINY